MNKSTNVIENDCPKEARPKSFVLPVVGIVVFGALLYWSINHIAGGCYGVKDIFTYCHVSVTGAL